MNRPKCVDKLLIKITNSRFIHKEKSVFGEFPKLIFLIFYSKLEYVEKGQSRGSKGVKTGNLTC